MRKFEKLLVTFCAIASILFANAQQPTIKILESGKRISIRGLSVVNDDIIWASGTGGSVARSTNGGNTFTWMKVPGYDKMDFRDIEAFDSNTAIIMGITAPAVVLKTTDGGASWKKVFEDTSRGAFIDAMAFGDGNRVGVIIGDPIVNNTLYEIATKEGGDRWVRILGTGSFPNGVLLKEGEAFFASSGTNVQMLDDNFNTIFASGGKASRLFYKGRIDVLPIMQGKETTGANSIAVYKKKKGIVVGGDFTKGQDTIPINNCVLFDITSRKPKFIIPQTPPHGYRSCVIYLDERNLVTCGTTGVDVSKDGGMNWELVTKDGFNVCQKAKKGNSVFLAGNGKIAKLVYP
ncbi:MAG: oxidoreductase [Bacteroidota bacterium]